MENLKLKKGSEITVNIPFTYVIGDEGFCSGKIIETIEDAKNEVRCEMESGMLNPLELLLNIEK